MPSLLAFHDYLCVHKNKRLDLPYVALKTADEHVLVVVYGRVLNEDDMP